MQIKGIIKKSSVLFLILFLISIIAVSYSNYTIKKIAESRTYNDTQTITKNKVGLLLGTSKYLIDGRINLYYQFRIEAALELYKSRKIDYILVSGDNGSIYYDEPSTFKEDLIKGGIPEEHIYLDYAGFRTLDSMVRAKEVFGQANFTVISQKFHNERAIYLATKHGINVIGYNAKDISGTVAYKMQIREYLARTKAVLDILLNTEPKFYGDPVEIK